MLRSINDLKNYSIVASDDSVGDVKDFLFDDLAWVTRYFVVETGNCLSSREVLICPEWTEEVSWSDNTVSIDLSRQSVKDAPVFQSAEQLNRQ
jgi:hypothetical protein